MKGKNIDLVKAVILPFWRSVTWEIFTENLTCALNLEESNEN